MRANLTANRKIAQRLAMFIARDLARALKRFSKFSVLALLGPRQSGKTTLARNAFNKHAYVSLEDPQARVFAQQDPHRFLKEHANSTGIIIDEIQYVPRLFDAIARELETKKGNSYFVVTASNNIFDDPVLIQKLAGNVGILTVLPLAIAELKEHALLASVDETILKGAYPCVYSEQILSSEMYPQYIQSFIERDVLKAIKSNDIFLFQKFMQLCAGRIGQLLNISDIATQCGIPRRTVEAWLALLEKHFIIFFLNPFIKNFNKRITKTPKLYFYDTGLACSLLGMDGVRDVVVSHFRGPLFECLMIADIVKQYFNKGLKPPLYFWRELNGRIEVDCLIDRGAQLIPLEVKAGETVDDDYFQSLKSWDALADSDPAQGYLIYGGASVQLKTTGNLVGWREAGSIVSKLEPEF